MSDGPSEHRTRVPFHLCHVDLATREIHWGKDVVTKLDNSSAETLEAFVARQGRIVPDGEIAVALGLRDKVVPPLQNESATVRRRVNRLKDMVGDKDKDLKSWGLESCFQRKNGEGFLFRPLDGDPEPAGKSGVDSDISGASEGEVPPEVVEVVAELLADLFRSAELDQITRQLGLGRQTNANAAITETVDEWSRWAAKRLNTLRRIGPALFNLLPTLSPKWPLRIALARTALPNDPAKSGDPLTRYIAGIPQMPHFTLLPPLLGGDRPLPVATMYVELRVCSGVQPGRRHQLAPDFSLAAEQAEIYRKWHAHPQDIQSLLADPGTLRCALLGDPGGGKTSLLKRIALDIAAGRHPGWMVPLVVPLVAWERDGSSASLLHYAADFVLRNRALSLQGPTPEDVDRLVLRFQKRAAEDGHGVLLMLDGFDEIGADAAERVRHQLEHGIGVSWLLTSRRAGFDGRLPADRHFELAGLDAVARDRLVHNWFDHQRSEPGAASHLLRQIVPGSRLELMGRNPFLLTLLCRLHQEGGTLPMDRVDVYAQIFELAGRQLQNLNRDPTLFNQNARRKLASFCHWLYSDARQAPRHLFNAEDWGKYGSNDELEAHYLSSRLLDRWGEEGDYHLVHLTLHEYLVAESVRSADPDIVIARRYLPAWRVVMRFACAMWWADGRADAVGRTLRALIEPVDHNGLMYIEAAHILTELGVTDSTEFVGFDLRERLWDVWLEETLYLSTAAGRALAQVGPDFVLNRVADVLAGRRALPLKGEEESHLAHKMALLQARELPRQSSARAAIELLGEVGSPDAEDLLIHTFRTDPELRLVAARVLASADSTRARHLLVTLVREEARDADVLLACCRGAGGRQPVALLPLVLEGVLKAATVDERETYLNCLRLMTEAEAAPTLLRILEGLEDPVWDDPNVLDVLAGLGTTGVENWVRSRLADLDTEQALDLVELRGLIPSSALLGVLTPNDLADLLDLGDEDVSLDAMSTLRDMAEWGWHIDEAAVARVQECVGTDVLDVSAFLVLTSVANLAAESGQAVSWINMIRDRVHDPVDDVRSAAAAALGNLQDRPSIPMLRALANDEDEALHVRLSAIGGLGAAGQTSEPTLHSLEQLVASESREIAYAAGDALALLSLNRLAQHRALSAALAALARACAERGFLLYEDAYVDARGALHAWEE